MLHRRWLFADQLGPHFLDDAHQPVLLVEARAVFRARPMHRQKAHLILSALRHRAAELGGRALLLRTETFREALRQVEGPVEVRHPSSRAALRFVRSVDGLRVLPPRGFVTRFEDFAEWADGNRRAPLRVDDFYRFARARHGVLTDRARPVRPRRARRLTDDGLAPPPPVEEDEIDAGVRRDLDRWAAEGVRFVGRDGPRAYPVTHAEAAARLRHFLTHRLPAYGRRHGVLRAGDPTLAHSLLSSSFNLGLLDPGEAIGAAEQEYLSGRAPRSAVDAFLRQLLGWREFLWQLYWYLDPDYRGRDWLPLTGSVPAWFRDLDADAVRARCLSEALRAVRDTGWAHQTQRLLVLGNHALQRGWRSSEVAAWFRDSFVDGTDWVMNATVVGMSQYADLARIDTRPYVVDGGHLDRIGDHCGGCAYRPEQTLGATACPYTGGFAAFLHRHHARLADDPRLAGELARQVDPRRRDAVLRQEERRGSAAP
ncbi:cryptochrome/photolyase family protein [Micromonospora sp. WMMD882]|uniref:cryptochrome/photolyase family protein n=1 Tax=Micromonospora sp. WMMD882 TaxID=3015151 RepID=UPI00248CDD3C|nr:cryptochrome/photolyase family protein [Micromonospora sp. WMMD882]WBB80763.1 cryptochrome/photolyase family protein [Micromonospora sp. WMMD882]